MATPEQQWAQFKNEGEAHVWVQFMAGVFKTVLTDDLDRKLGKAAHVADLMLEEYRKRRSELGSKPPPTDTPGRGREGW